MKPRNPEYFLPIDDRTRPSSTADICTTRKNIMTNCKPLTITRSISLSALTLLSAAVAIACDGQDDVDCGDTCASAYAERGSRRVATSTREHGELSLRAWYPTDALAEESTSYPVVLQLPGFPADPMPIFGHAIDNAHVAATSHELPLVILSHGFGLNPEWYAPLGEHLASYGFFVLAPMHRGESDWASDVIAVSASRPQEVSAAIDFALDGEFASAIDGEHIALIGHSYGGYTSLAVGGARIDYSALRARCEGATEPFEIGFMCPPFLEGEEELAAAMGLDSVPEGLWPSMADARIDAIVPIAGDAFAFSAEGLASVTVPMFAIGGTADTAAPWDWGTELAFEHAGSSDKRLLGFEGGEHFLPLADCQDMPWMSSMPEEFRSYLCDDPAWSKADAHAHIQHFVTAFLKESLQGDARAREVLRPYHYQGMSGLLYQHASQGQGSADNRPPASPNGHPL